MFRGEWDAAEKILFEASNQGQSERNVVVLNDLKAQLLVRHAESLYRSGKLSQAADRVVSLKKFVTALAPNSIDLRMREHIAKVRMTLSALLSRADGEQRKSLDEVSEWLSRIAPSNYSNEESTVTSELTNSGVRHGFIKHKGLQPSFGFITCERSKEEYFVHKNVMSQEVWQELISGSRVVFTVGSVEEGKPKVTSVEIANGTVR